MAEKRFFFTQDDNILFKCICKDVLFFRSFCFKYHSFMKLYIMLWPRKCLILRG